MASVATREKPAARAGTVARITTVAGVLLAALLAHALREWHAWRRFGFAHHLALILNALLLALVLLFAAANSIFELRFGVMIALAGGSAPFVTLCGLWWCRYWRPMRVLMLLANFTAGAVASGVVLPWFLFESLPGISRYWFPFDVAATLLLTSAPASALWVQWRACAAHGRGSIGA